MSAPDTEIFVGVLGSFTGFHRGTDSFSEDAYSVFAARSEALGWSSSVLPAEPEPVLWRLNDAGLSPGPDWLVAWFQVAAGTYPLSRILHPLGLCATDTVRRLGDLGFDGLEYLLADAAIDTSIGNGLGRLLSSVNWFCTAPHAEVVRCDVIIRSPEPVDQLVASVSEVLRSWKTEPFQFGPIGGRDADAVVVAPLVAPSRLWTGGHHAVLPATGPEASADSFGWLAEAVAAACALSSGRGPLAIQVVRAGLRRHLEE